MSYNNIVLDKWAANESTVFVTICVQSICCILSFFCFIVRLVQVCKYKRDHSSWETFASTMMTISPLLCMGMNVLYLLTHLWNYIHWFEESNVLDCRLWFIILVCLLWLARIFLYQFLLLRSLVVFSRSIYQISTRFVLIFLIMHAILIIVCTSVLLTDFTPIQPFQGFCFRIIGDAGFIAAEIWWAADCMSAIIVWIVFWLKVVQIRKTFAGCKMSKTETSASDPRNNNNERNVSETERIIYKSFRKQMFLGILTVCGSIIIYVLKVFLTVLLGVMFALDATTNNVLLFLFFKENERYYDILCCANVCSSESKMEFYGGIVRSSSDATYISRTDTKLYSTTALPPEKETEVELTDIGIGYRNN